MTFANVPDTQWQLIDALAAITTAVAEDDDLSAVLYQITFAGRDLLDGAASGILLSDPRGTLAVAAASDEQARLVELLQSQFEQGPCVDAIRTDRTIEIADIGREVSRWPIFVAAARDQGYRGVLAVPIRLNGEPVGGLNVLYRGVAEIGPYQHRVARVLTGLAVLALTKDRGENRSARLTERTLGVLNDRATVGQAIGLVAGALNISPDEGRALLERYATTRALPVREAARSLIDGRLSATRLAAEA